MRQTKTSCLLFLTLASLVVATTTGFAEPLSIADAVRKALDYAPMIKAQSMAQKVAHARAQEARAMKGVRLQVSANESRNNSPLMVFGSRLNQGQVTMADFNPARLNEPDYLENLQLRTQVTIPVHLGGMDRHAVQAARSQEAAEQSAVEYTSEEVIFRAIQAYLDVLLTRESVVVAEKACEASGESVRNAQAAVDALRAVESDVLQARVHHGQNEETLLQMRNRHQLAAEGLATILGVPSATEFELTMPFIEQVCELCHDDPAPLLAKALQQRPEVSQLQFQQAALRSQERVMRGVCRPHVAVGGAVEHNRQYIGKQGRLHSILFAQVEWNVSDGGESRYKAEQARHQQERVAFLRQDLIDRIHLEIREAVMNINNALERIRVSQEAVAHSQESLRILRNRYQAGLAIMSDVLGMEASLLRHRMNHVQALHHYALSRAKLRRSMGELTPERCDILQQNHE